MRRIYVKAGAIALLAASQALVFGQGSGLSIPSSPTGYSLVSQTFITRSQSYFTYQALLFNNGPALASVTASATSTSPNVTVVAGQGTLHFAPVPANGRVYSTDSFTILVTGGVQFDGSQITWSFNGPNANAGPAQSVPVLTTVTLSGSGSTNPGGIGTLTYSWSVQSTPPGSTAKITNPTSVMASFTPDLVGSYTIALTVSNGTQSDTATTIISTTDVPPTANAGPNRTVTIGSLVTLDGSKSFDLNGAPLQYVWSFVSLPANSNAQIFSLRSPNATFVLDQPGSYVLGLVVNDGTLSSAMSTVTITTGNTPPVAVAKANGTTSTPNSPVVVGVGAIVQLDGSQSTDVDGNPLTYSWSLNLSQAPGSKAIISNSTILNPFFTADVPGIYVAQLIVTDAAISSIPATVTVATNIPPAPVANAGPNQKVLPGTVVQLQGSGSDVNSLPLTYSWSLTVPPSSKATLSATNISNPMFTADLAGTYVAQLTVSNGTLTSMPSTVMITSSSPPPVAVPTTATPSVIIGNPVSVTGSSSTDPNNLPITSYLWSLNVPPGSQTKLSGANTVTATFVPDIPGTYVAQLIVADQFSSSAPATVSITAGQMTVSLSPNPLTMATTSSQTLTVSISPGATSAPIVVTLSGFDSNIISLPVAVSIPPGSSAANVIVNPSTLGTTSITGSASGYKPATIPVSVVTPTITLTFDNNATSVGLNQTIGGTITLSVPGAQPNGTMVTLVDIQDHDSGNIPGLVTFGNSQVLVPAGSTTARFTMTGTTVGTVEVFAGSPGFARVNLIFFDVNP